MFSRVRYALYDRNEIIEGDVHELAEKLGVPAHRVRDHICHSGKYFGKTFIKSFEALVQILDAETGKVMFEGKSQREISRRLGACKSYVSNIFRRPTSQYAARLVYVPTEEYQIIMRGFGHDV